MATKQFDGADARCSATHPKWTGQQLKDALVSKIPRRTPTGYDDTRQATRVASPRRLNADRVRHRNGRSASRLKGRPPAP